MEEGGWIEETLFSAGGLMGVGCCCTWRARRSGGRSRGRLRRLQVDDEVNPIHIMDESPCSLLRIPSTAQMSQDIQILQVMSKAGLKDFTFLYWGAIMFLSNPVKSVLRRMIAIATNPTDIIVLATTV